MMKIVQEILPGCLVLKPDRFEDHRGVFIKTYHETVFADLGINFRMREEFYSISGKNVLRGMHFQVPPHDHDKLVYCTRGEVLDVLLDLRLGPDYGKCVSVTLSDKNMLQVFIPKGIAHGFLSLTDETLMLYKTSTVHAPTADRGIRWDSFGFDWGIENPVISARDAVHPPLASFISCF